MLHTQPSTTTEKSFDLNDPWIFLASSSILQPRHFHFSVLANDLLPLLLNVLPIFQTSHWWFLCARGGVGKWFKFRGPLWFSLETPGFSTQSRGRLHHFTKFDLIYRSCTIDTMTDKNQMTSPLNASKSDSVLFLFQDFNFFFRSSKYLGHPWKLLIKNMVDVRGCSTF